MPGPPPAVAAARVAVRRWLEAEHVPEGALVLVACSGGADSLALVAAAGFVGPRAGLRIGAVVVDHGLQTGSAQVAAQAAGACRDVLGDDAPVVVIGAEVSRTAAGPEADARQGRYAALARAAGELGGSVVLLGHTRDDQAEQVLLGLARGSGARSLSGMPATRLLAAGSSESSPVLIGRPFLGRAGAPGMTRAQTRDACAALGLSPWADPHNDDDRFARVRARRALADLEQVLGPGLSGNLARTADLLRDDADALESAAAKAYLELGAPPWPVERLSSLPRAVRTRVWREAALAAGSPGTDLTSEHLLSVEALVTGWRGQGPVHLPRGVRAGRDRDGVWLRREA